MVTISSSAAAPSAIGARPCPSGFTADGRPDGKGGYLVTLDRHVVERLAAILKLAERGG